MRIKLFLLALMAALCAFAQSESNPLQVIADPPSTAVGGSVMIHGNVPVDGGGSGKIVVTPPSGESVVIPGKWDGEGNYSAQFTDTKREGQYKVAISSSGGHASGTAEFSVKSAGNMTDELQNEENALVQSANDAERLVEDLLQMLPPSPATVEAQEGLKPLKQRLAELPAQAANLKKALEPINQFTAKYPTESRHFSPLWQSLGQWKGQSAAKREQVNRHLIASRAKGANCERIDQINEGLSFVSFLLNLIGDPFKAIPEKLRDAAMGFTKDFDAAHLSGALSDDPGKQFLFSETIKVSTSFCEGPGGWLKATVGLAVDAAGFCTQQVFAKYCEKYEGPFTASLHAEFERGGSTWWKYDTRLDGTLTLRYAKTTVAAQAAHVEGEFRGSGTQFTCWENALPVLFPDLMKDTAARKFHRIILPNALPQPEFEGKMAAALVPTAFFIPVEGEIVDNKLTLRLKAATVDFDENLSAHVINVVFSPMLLVPKIVAFDLPYKQAHFILMRATSEKPLEIPVTMDRAKKVAIISQDYQRVVNPSGAKASYKLSLKTCNPGCS